MKDSNTISPRVALIGFGEAGSIFARTGEWSGHASGWDLLPERRAAMAECEVEAGRDAASALAGADLVLSLVTADQALKAAQEYAPLLPKGALFCDMNSVAPGTKQAGAAEPTRGGAAAGRCTASRRACGGQRRPAAWWGPWPAPSC